MIKVNSHPPTDKHNQPPIWSASCGGCWCRLPCHLHHKNKKSESLLWQQSLTGWLKSQRYCLSKTTIRAVLSQALLYKKACGFPTQLKAFGQWAAAFVTLHQTYRGFSVGDNDRIHLRWPCCERFQGKRLCCSQQCTVDTPGVCVCVCVWMTKLHSV